MSTSTTEPLRVGLLVGRERTFPDALIAHINARGEGVVAEYATVDLTFADEPCPYAALLDRISHDVSCYQPYLKRAALGGVRVVNDPFWRIADDKFYDTALCASLGIAAPKTALLPSKEYGPDVSAGSLRNLKYPLSWQRLVERLGFPMYLKPHWGGGWRDVYRVTSLEELWRVYDKTGRLTMLAQEEIRWEQYVRCLVVGRELVLPAPWDPRLGHFDRYKGAVDSMPPLSEELRSTIVEQARRLCRALGYDMNTVEFAVRDGVPYAIDMMNSAPDFDVSSLGEEQFTWVVGAMSDLLVRLAKSPRTPEGVAGGASEARPAPWQR